MMNAALSAILNSCNTPLSDNALVSHQQTFLNSQICLTSTYWIVYYLSLLLKNTVKKISKNCTQASEVK